MNITRHNYEEFFILYLDNELSKEDRLRVETFAAAHPDLKDELDVLLNSKLIPDDAVIFENKEQLLKTVSDGLISDSNYEEWLLLYTDNELDASQRKAVERFASLYPAIGKELELLQKTKLQPEEEIIFPFKESLYRKEEEAGRVVIFTWRRIAIAATLLLAVSTAAFLMFNNKKEGTEIAAGEKKNTQPSVVSPENKPATKDADTKSELAVTGKEATQKQVQPDQQSTSPVEKKNEPGKINEKINVQNSADLVKEQIANVIERKKDNNLPQPKYNPNVNETIPQDNPIAYSEKKPAVPVKEALTLLNDINQSKSVTPGSDQPLNNGAVSAALVNNTEDDNQVAANEPGRKNKLRGFFRKITRTFEKTTNIKATDDEDRLLVGGLAIRL